MALLDRAIGSVVPGGSLAEPLTIARLALLVSRAMRSGGIVAGAAKPGSGPPSAPGAPDRSVGGLGVLLQRFQQNGCGNIAKSWIGTGENQPIAPNPLAEILGQDALNRLSQNTGLPQQDLLAHLSQLLPSVVDKLASQARLPTESAMAAGS
jgi:uncharacterized protein YidB (DUF937 family)